MRSDPMHDDDPTPLDPPPAPPALWDLEVRDLDGKEIVTIWDVVNYELAGSVWFIKQLDGEVITLPLDRVIAVLTPKAGACA